MREGIHPDYYQAKVVCNCGNEFVTGSTKEDIHVEICSKCHPFYTGQQKAAAARGRIDKFNKKIWRTEQVIVYLTIKQNYRVEVLESQPILLLRYFTHRSNI